MNMTYTYIYVAIAVIIIVIAAGALYTYYGISEQYINLGIGIGVIIVWAVCFYVSPLESQRFFLEKHNIILRIYQLYNLILTNSLMILNFLLKVIIGLRLPDIFLEVLKFSLWVAFFVGVSIVVLALFGVPIDIPFFNIGGGSSYNEDDVILENDNNNSSNIISLTIYKFFKEAINNTQRSIQSGTTRALGTSMDFVNYEHKERETTDGRCNETDYVTDGNKCISNKKKKDLEWELDFVNEDYDRLPEEFKKKNLEIIRIPYKEVGGVYIPDCKASYYPNTKKKTGLLTNEYHNNSYSCVYLHKNKAIYR